MEFSLSHPSKLYSIPQAFKRRNEGKESLQTKYEAAERPETPSVRGTVTCPHRLWRWKKEPWDKNHVAGPGEAENSSGWQQAREGGPVPMKSNSAHMSSEIRSTFILGAAIKQFSPANTLILAVWESKKRARQATPGLNFWGVLRQYMGVVWSH